MYPFSEGSFAPRNAWYVVAFPHEVDRTLLTRWVLNQPIVLYRKQDGTAVAVGGRCPHRHFPLGESRLVGDAIQCGYHGITFGADGRCTAVPSQTNVPGVYRIPNYPLVERGLWLWIWPGDPALADESLLPDVADIGLAEPDQIARPFYSLSVKGRYQLLNDNLLDLTHLSYLHDGSIGTEENASTPETRTVEERCLRSRRTIASATPPQILQDQTGYDGPIERLSGMDFHLPGFHAGIDESRVAAEGAPRDRELLVKTRVWHAVTPSLFDETLYFFAMSATTEAQLDFAQEYLKPVIQEDVFATEEIEKMVTRLGSLPPELMIKTDALAVQGRRMMQAMIDRERTVTPRGSAPDPAAVHEPSAAA